MVSVGLELILALAIALLLDQRWRGRSAVEPYRFCHGLSNNHDGSGLAVDFQHPLRTD